MICEVWDRMAQTGDCIMPHSVGGSPIIGETRTARAVWRPASWSTLLKVRLPVRSRCRHGACSVDWSRRGPGDYCTLPRTCGKEYVGHDVLRRWQSDHRTDTYSCEVASLRLVTGVAGERWRGRHRRL